MALDSTDEADTRHVILCPVLSHREIKIDGVGIKHIKTPHKIKPRFKFFSPLAIKRLLFLTSVNTYINEPAHEKEKKRGGGVGVMSIFPKMTFSFSWSAYIEEHGKENRMKKLQHSTKLQLFKETTNCAN